MDEYLLKRVRIRADIYEKIIWICQVKNIRRDDLINALLLKALRDLGWWGR